MTEKVILIYDDDHADTFADNISVHRPSYLCLPYFDARELLAEIQDGLKFDLFLTDLAAERVQARHLAVSGDDLGRKVRELYPNLPIVTISAYEFKPQFSNRHLLKPVTSDELIPAIDSLL